MLLDLGSLWAAAILLRQHSSHCSQGSGPALRAVSHTEIPEWKLSLHSGNISPGGSLELSEDSVFGDTWTSLSTKDAVTLVPGRVTVGAKEPTDNLL